MKEIKVEEAVGTVLVHDLTQIIPGEYKGAKFKKGHIVKEEDIPVLLSMGKKKLYVLEKNDTDVHENLAATRIASAVMGSGVIMSEPSEGKIEIFAELDGLLKINKNLLEKLLDQDEIMFATVHGNRLVKKGDKVAGTRVIPLFVSEKIVEEAENICKEETLIQVIPLKKLRVGLVTTGSEIYSGLIEDKFGAVLAEKFNKLGSRVERQLFADDDEEMIVDRIQSLLKEGMELICVTGGMSVDPDDRTPSAIRKTGAEVVCYGAPVLPGAMFLMAYMGDVPIVGLPGCVMYSKISIFDLIVPRIISGEKITRKAIKKLAQGGLCLNCQDCNFPNCGFGV
ncbi:MAG: molybdopterin-binding protein [Aminipila sp.]